ncbi:MAG: cation:proton antiporter [Bacteroidia bacterium]
MEILQQFIIAFVVAMVVVVILSRLKIPSVIGFLFTGILIGPYILNIVHSGHEIEVLAEIGVMLLMFTIGLEFSIKRILSMRHEVLVLGGLQILVTISVVFFIMKFFLQHTLQESILASFVISMSSTAIVLKSLQDKGQLQTPSGRIMTGILLFQDICVVPLIILTPLIGKINEIDITEILLKIAISFALIGLIFYLSKFLLPKLFDLICSFRINELFMILVLTLCFGLAILTNYLGFSLALGAFIAGMILAESDFIYQIEADIKPLKNVFLSIFFISVGMLLNVHFVIQNPLNVFFAAISILVVKTLIIAAIAKAFKTPLNMSLLIGLGISQIGEFSFMLLNIARPLNFISDEYYQIFLSSSIISMMATPAFLGIGNLLLHNSILKQDINDHVNLEQHVLIAGFGVNGQNLSKILKSLNIPYKIIEINPNTVKKFKKEGEDIVFGDITKQDNLLHLGIDKARMMVIAISDWDATLKAVAIGRKLNPNLKIIVRTEFVTQIEPLYKAGADIVISQEFEASLEIAAYVLKNLGIAGPIVRLKSEQLRKRHYGFFSGKQIGTQSKIAELAAITYINDTYMVLGDSKLIGKNIKLIKSYLNSDDVTIIGIVRGEQIIINPSDDIEIEKMDMILLFGKQYKMDFALEILDNLNTASNYA